MKGNSILLFVLGNPIEETYSLDRTWRDRIAKVLPELEMLDGNSPCVSRILK